MNKFYGYRFEIGSELIESMVATTEYGQWKEEWVHRVSSVVTKDHQNPDIASILDIPTGAEAYVVWAEWSYGDSFGEAYRGSAEAFGIFEHEVFAQQFVDYLNSRRQNCGMFTGLEQDSDVCVFNSGDGQIFKLNHLPWIGYFDHLEELHVERVIVN